MKSITGLTFPRIAGVCILGLLAGAAQASAIVVVLGASADAHVRQAEPDTNFGSADRMFATRGETDQTTEKIYMKFDASGLPGDVIDIVDFQAVFMNQFARAGWAYLLTGPDANDWTESAITYNNAPANVLDHYGFVPAESLRLGFLRDVAQGQTADFIWDPDGDVVSLKGAVMAALNEGDRTITLAIERSSTNRNLSYASREHATNHGPQLVLEVIPEPSTYAFVLGLLVLGGLALRRYRRR